MSEIYQQIKDSLNLQTVIESFGVQFKTSGSTTHACCPFHEEKTPSFTIGKDPQTYKCFGCDISGDVFTFLEHYNKMTPGQALSAAAKLAAIELPNKSSHKDQSLRIKSLKVEASRYFYLKRTCSAAQDYLIEKRKHKPDSLEKMRVGWNDGGLQGHLWDKGYKEQELLDSGLFRKSESKGLYDFIPVGVAVFSHFVGDEVYHFTFKDPKKEKEWQYPSKYRSQDWKFYNQDVIRKYNEIILVEGENDLLSLMDAGVENVVAVIGQVSDDQVKTLKTHFPKKHLYLWLDNDFDDKKEYAKGVGFSRKICQTLHEDHFNISIIVQPQGKDPDDYLKGFSGDHKKEIKRLQSEALDYLSWELFQIKQLEGLAKRVEKLQERDIFKRVHLLSYLKKDIYLEKLQELGLSIKAIDEQLDKFREISHDLAVYFEEIGGPKQADPNVVVKKIFRYFHQEGMFFRKTEDRNKVFLFFENILYMVANERPFNALMKRFTGLLPTKEPGRSVWESLASEAYNHGTVIDVFSWIETDLKTDSIFINLNLEGNKIFKLTPSEISVIPNGINKDKVLLKSSPSIKGFNFLPDCNIQEGMKKIKKHIMDVFTCENEQKFLIICWFISCFLVHYSDDKFLMKFSGGTKSGKTTAAKVLSMLLFGQRNLGDPTPAAANSKAARDPLVIIDNLENKDITKMILKFLLICASGGQRDKRTSGTESDITSESLDALILMTAIEPFEPSELINRTLEIEFVPKFKSNDFIASGNLRELARSRDLILSTLLKFIQQDILPNLSHMEDFLMVLRTDYPNHSKDRMDEHMVLFMLILDKLIKYIPCINEDNSCKPKDIRDAWIIYQDNRATENTVDANPIVKMLDRLVDEHVHEIEKTNLPWQYDIKYKDVMTYKHPEYLIKMLFTKPETYKADNEETYKESLVIFTCTSGQLSSAFDKLARNCGIKNVYSSGAILASRLKNEKETLKQKRWHLVSRPGYDPYYTKIGGSRFYRFVKTRIEL